MFRPDMMDRMLEKNKWQFDLAENDALVHIKVGKKKFVTNESTQQPEFRKENTDQPFKEFSNKKMEDKMYKITSGNKKRSSSNNNGTYFAPSVSTVPGFGEAKPFCCSFCSYATHNIDSYYSHIQLHSGANVLPVPPPIPPPNPSMVPVTMDNHNLQGHKQPHTREDVAYNFNYDHLNYQGNHPQPVIDPHAGIKAVTSAQEFNIPVPVPDCSQFGSKENVEKEKINAVNESFADHIKDSLAVQAKEEAEAKTKSEPTSGTEESGPAEGTPPLPPVGFLEIQADSVKYIQAPDSFQKFNPLKCRFCSYTTIKRYHLQRHLSGHFKLQTYKCTECSYGSHRKDHLQRHISVHNKGKAFRCFKCRFGTDDEEELSRHTQRHIEKSQYSCNTCQHITTSREDFKQHLRTCSNRYFGCTICDYVSQRKDHLQRHLKTHIAAGR